MTAAAWPQNYLTDAGYEVQNWAGALTVTSGTAAVVTDDVDTDSGATKSLKATYNGAAASQSRMPVSAAIPASKGPFSISIRVKAPSTNAAPCPIEFRLYNTGLTSFLSFYHSVANDGEWHTIVATIDGLTASGFTLFTDAVGHIQVREDRSGARGLPNLNIGEYFLIGPITVNKLSRPKLMFTIDDGVDIVTNFSGYPTGAPASGGNFRDIFTYYAKPATCYVIPSVVDTVGYATLSSLLSAQTAGWSIAAHSQPSYEGNIGNGFHGLRTLGTFGYGPFSVSAVDTVQDTMTITSHPFSYSRVVFSATSAPGGVTLNTAYWLRSVDANTVSLHPSYNAAVLNTGKIDITSSGSGVTCRWQDAVQNNSLMRSTVSVDMAACRALGFTAWQHYALPQGGSDREVIDALIGLGLKSVRGVGTGYPAPYGISRISPVPDYYTDEFNLLGYSFDLASLGSAGTISAINTGLRNGASMSVYCHGISSTIATYLDAVLAHAVRLEQQGLLDVVNIEDWYLGLTQPALVAA